MSDGSITPSQYEQDLSAAIDQLQSLSGDFSGTANDLQLVQKNLNFDVIDIADIAGANAPGSSGGTSPGADFYYGNNGGGYRTCAQTVLANLGTLIQSLGEMANGLNDAAGQLQQRENDAITAFGNLLSPPPAPPSPVRREPRIF